VDDLLDVARVSTGKVLLGRAPLDLGALVTRSLATRTAGGRTERHRLEVETEPVWVDADDARLEQIVTNLVGNALKYTPAGGTVRVVVRREGDRAVLQVADTGVGIPSHVIGRVFDLFVQGDRSIDRSQGGLGVGLTLVRRLVEMHGGVVEAASPGAGAGSVFTVRLPALADPDPLPPARAPRPSQARRRVLVVEDNSDVREMLRAALELNGHDVHEAEDGPSGVAAARALRPEVVLVDIGLPGLDGYEVARQIRADGADDTLVLIALTGYGQPEDRRRAMDAGFDAHLVKPVDPPALAVLICEVQPKASRADKS
jgi:CheY-like chemotaxis protein/anti-sigma regulatory factor (Ser/Thr protein kinase)